VHQPPYNQGEHTLISICRRWAVILLGKNAN
jgi:hypothetical protein